MNLLFFSSLLILPVAVTSVCQLGNGPLNACGAHTIVLLDATTAMGSVSNIEQQYQFVEKNLMSAYNLNHNRVLFSFGYYGMSDRSISYSPVYIWFGKQNAPNICFSLTSLHNNLKNDNMGQLSINEALTTVAQIGTNKDSPPYDLIILFTATNNQGDIDQAMNVRNTMRANFLIINMGTGDFSSWTNTYVICTKLPFTPGLEKIIANQACRRSEGSFYCLYTTTTPQFWTAIPTTTSMPTTSTTWSPPPASQCPCDSSRIWNDVFFLLDGSNVLTEKNFDEMSAFILSAGFHLPIGQAEQNQTRVAIGIYGNQAHLIASLNKYTNSNEFAVDTSQIIPLKEEHTNIVDGLNLARDQFDDPQQHRASARKVIVIAASSYRAGNYDLPTTTATTFKLNGGIIIVFAYGDLHGVTSDILKDLASPGYYVDANVQGKWETFIDLQCRANCFCPNAYSPVSSTVTLEPVDGCFFTSDIEALQILGKRTCHDENNGFLAVTKSAAQKTKVLSKFQSKTPVWIGLEQVNNQWTWADGSPLEEPIVSTGGGNCATLARTTGFNTQITQTDCFAGAYNYGCEAIPCSSTNYCSVN